MRTKFFFASDIHGSNLCFRKFVNAGRFYDAQVLILGGDITGKAMVPIVRLEDGRFRLGNGDSERLLKSEARLNEVIKEIDDYGRYSYIADPAEFEEMSAKPELVDRIFKRLMVERLELWMALADERLRGTGRRCYISPGNDDVMEIDSALNSGTLVVNPEEKRVEIDGEHEMITLGYSNRTPWDSPRELDEDALLDRIDAMADRVKDVEKAMFNIHVPPIDTPVDQAPKLDKNLKPVMSGGEAVMMSAGSTAVREAIEKYQPLIGIHGHIHESKGMVKIGRTVCFNPGSEYNAGILRGLLCELDGGSITSHLFTSG